MYFITSDQWESIPANVRTTCDGVRTCPRRWITDNPDDGDAMFREGDDFQIMDDYMFFTFRTVVEASSLSAAARQKWVEDCAEKFNNDPCTQEFVERAADIAGQIADRREAQRAALV